MQLEAITAVAVSGIPAQVSGQVDDVDSLKGALLDADTATNAELF